GHRHHPQAGVAAGIDARERFQVHGDVERQAVEAAAPAHPDAEGGDLGVVDVDARRAVAPSPLDVPFAQGVDHRLFDPAHILAYAQLQPAQVQQRVGDDLAGAVVGHLPAPVDLHHGNVARCQHVLGFAGLAEGEHRIVLHQPQFVRAVLATRVSEGLHRAPHRLVCAAPQVPDQQLARYSVHFTSGCSRSTACATSYCSRDSARNVSFTETNLPPLDSRVATVSRSTGRPAAASSEGSRSSRPEPAGPIAVISNSPGNWKPCSGLSDLISIYSDSHHIQNSSHRRVKKPPSSTASSATSGRCAITLPSSDTLTVPISWPLAIGATRALGTSMVGLSCW